MAALKSQTSNTRIAVMSIIFTVLVLSMADAAIKAFDGDFPLTQLFVLRSIITLPVLILVLTRFLPETPLRPQSTLWSSLRSLMLLLSLVAYYESLPRLDFSAAAAVYYTLPLFITLFAALLIREPVGLRGWVGVTLGFVGVIVLLRPQASDFNLSALLPLAAAILYALAMTLTRTKCREENPLVLALVFNVIAIFAGLTITGGGWFVSTVTAQEATSNSWVEMTAGNWGLVVLLSCAMLVGSVGTAIAYQLGPSSVVSTYDFSYLAFAVLWGALLFSERLGLAETLGIALIVCAGILVVTRRTEDLG